MYLTVMLVYVHALYNTPSTKLILPSLAFFQHWNQILVPACVAGLFSSAWSDLLFSWLASTAWCPFAFLQKFTQLNSQWHGSCFFFTVESSRSTLPQPNQTTHIKTGKLAFSYGLNELLEFVSCRLLLSLLVFCLWLTRQFVQCEFELDSLQGQLICVNMHASVCV